MRDWLYSFKICGSCAPCPSLAVSSLRPVLAPSVFTSNLQAEGSLTPLQDSTTMLRDSGQERGNTRRCLMLHPATDRSRLLAPALGVVQWFMQHSFNAKGMSILGSGMKTIFSCLAVGHQHCRQGCLLLSLISWHLHSSQQRARLPLCICLA